MQSSLSLRKLALLAGSSYLVIFITGIFANFLVLEQLVVKEDPVATWENITGNLGTFKLGLIAFIIMVLADLFLAWALYVLFRPVEKDLSLLAGWFRVVNVTLFGVALFHLLGIVSIAGGTIPDAAHLEQVQREVMTGVSNFNFTWLLGLVFFSIHLFILASLVIKDQHAPNLIGVLLALAGVGYMVDSMAQFLMSNYTEVEDLFAMVVVIPGVVGELAFTVWLLWKGGRDREESNAST